MQLAKNNHPNASISVGVISFFSEIRKKFGKQRRTFLFHNSACYFGAVIIGMIGKIDKRSEGARLFIVRAENDLFYP